MSESITVKATMDVRYADDDLKLKGERGFVCIRKELVSVFIDSETSIDIPYQDLMRAAAEQQREAVKKADEQDSLDEVDFQAMGDKLRDLMAQDTEGILAPEPHQVPINQFSGRSPEGLACLLNYIIANDLREQAPWSAIWNLWRCLEARHGRE